MSIPSPSRLDHGGIFFEVTIYTLNAYLPGKYTFIELNLSVRVSYLQAPLCYDVFGLKALQLARQSSHVREKA